MAEVRPFRGVIYDAARVVASDVLAPPYDVIDDDGRAGLAARDANNAVHLILPSGDGDSKYQNAAAHYRSMQADGILKRSERPSLYRYCQTFEHPERVGQRVTRRGFVAAVRLHRFDERIILPHERTLSGPKLDRLKLMRATKAHTSPIFGLYSDPSGEGERLFAAAENNAPIIDGETDDGTTHRVWEVTDREVIGAIERLLAPMKIYIADGHHRYETMLAYRDELRQSGEVASDSSAEFATMFLANMDDPGMVVLATHRQVHSVDEFSKEELEQKIDSYFDRVVIDRSVGAVRHALASLKRPGFVMGVPHDERLHLLCLRTGASHSALTGAVGALDVSVLHNLVFEEMLGIDKQRQAAKTNIRYIKDTESAVAALDEGQATFFLQPTTLRQVRSVSDASEFMPQKSTFFVPKLASGVVFRSIDASEPLS